MATPFPFSAGAVLTAAQLNSIAEAGTSFTPTWSGYTRGNGTTVAYYLQVNKLVYVYINETLGTTSAVTGALTLTLPFTAANVNSIQYFGGQFADSSAFVSYAAIVQGITTTTAQLRAINAAGTYANYVATSATVPMTWASTDQIITTFWYERT